MIFLKLEYVFSELKSHDKIFIHSAAATPQILVKQMVEHVKKHNLKGIEIYHIHTEGECDYALSELSGHFKVHSFFNGSNMRKVQGEQLGLAYIPIFLSDIPHLFYNKKIELDVALVQLSPPDNHGMCSLGPSIDVSLAAVLTAKKVIAQINPKMPRTFGEQIPFSKVSRAYQCNELLPEIFPCPLTDVEKSIGKHIANLIEDGSTLQMGIGNIPNAVLALLENHKDLGIHSEMFSDGIIPLVEKGVITGKFKIKHPRKIVTSFVVGSKKVYDFVDNNPEVLFLDCAYTNNPHVIATNPKVVAINSAIEIDLTGQVCADSIGKRIYSGVGGQMDFIRGAALSKEGRPIIALPSKTKSGESRLVSVLRPGAGVVTTRAHVQYVVTEFGVAYLHGLTLKERAQALIAIAAPEHQEKLEREFFECYKKLS